MTRHWGDGSIYKRGNRFWISYSVNGKVHKESGGKTKSEAREKLQSRKADIHHGTYIDTKQAKVTINQLLDCYLDFLKIKGSKSVERLVSMLKPVREEFGCIRAVKEERNLQDVVTEALESYLKKKEGRK